MSVKHSEVTNEISAALAKAQGALENPTKDKTANVKSDKGSFSYTYATIADGLVAVRKALSDNGIAIIQAPRIEGDVMMLDTRLAHASDQWFECEWPVCKLPSPPQQIGSAITYARRYSLFSMVGIAGEDDDGKAAGQSPPPPPKQEPTIDLNQAKEIDALIKTVGATRRHFCEFYKISRVQELPAKLYEHAIAALNEAAPEIDKTVSTDEASIMPDADPAEPPAP